MTAPTLMILDPSDTVAVVLTDMAEGEIREGLTARAAIPRGHKIARSAMAAGSPVLKYGQVMAVASRDIAVGEHVHVHNVESRRGRGDLTAAAKESA